MALAVGLSRPGLVSPARDGRNHVHQTIVQRGVQRAVLASGIPRRTTCHKLRHMFATHLLDDGCDICTVQELLGRKEVATTVFDTHVPNSDLPGVRSHADRPYGG